MERESERRPALVGYLLNSCFSSGEAQSNAGVQIPWYLSYLTLETDTTTTRGFSARAPMAQNSDGDTEIYETLPVFPALTGPWRLAAVCSTGSKPSGRPTGTSSLTLSDGEPGRTEPRGTDYVIIMSSHAAADVSAHQPPPPPHGYTHIYSSRRRRRDLRTHSKPQTHSLNHRPTLNYRMSYGTWRSQTHPPADNALNPTASAPLADNALNPTASAPLADNALNPTASAPPADNALNPTASAPSADNALNPTASAPPADNALNPTASAPSADNALNPTVSAPPADNTLHGCGA
ncbi:hypothetical protein JZ751_008459 [Albula glossodonta]|uniref:Uncharacterized protein n=1 Tax=Albula glossodonta TaxID=121402 RepID=A0A8T2MPF9_9TELE|nr:hypothetical protein JZ751_008459 [Albula glossodonta]